MRNRQEKVSLLEELHNLEMATELLLQILERADSLNVKKEELIQKLKQHQQRANFIKAEMGIKVDES